jgi:cell wall-associated NlpC family hydrolase
VTKTANNTHRRPMRAMTPAVRAGRTAAGAAIAATMLLGGGAAASADGPATADGSDLRPQSLSADQGPAIVPTADVAAQTLGDGAGPKKADKDTKTVPKAVRGQSFATITVEAAPEPEPEPAVEDDAEQQDQATADQGTDETTQQSADGQDDASSQDADGAGDQNANDGDQKSSNGGGDSDGSSSTKTSDDSGKKDESKKSDAPRAAKGDSIVATARSGIGSPYVSGGTSPSGWDCSGFVQWVYAQHGISLPRVDSAQANAGTRIPKSEAKPGDLVHTPGHIGIYAGGNKMIDAGNSRVGTTERDIYSGNWEYIRIG